jgi:Ca-activated chloride channel family protein
MTNDTRFRTSAALAVALTSLALTSYGGERDEAAPEIDADVSQEAVKVTNSPADAMLILDASGSMWGEIDGVDKIVIAREVIGEMIENWDENTSLGLMAYGHHRKGDCNDIELLLSPGALDRETFIDKVNGLSPVGMTPLTEAVKRAAEALNYTENRATVILVSDGEETCNLDPCATGKALEKAGIDFTAHIIGFDVTEEQAVGLKCLAAETGGMYLEASNADELGEAMANASDMVTVDAPPIELGDATLSVPAEVPAGATFKAEWTGPKNRYDYLRILQPDGVTIYDLAHVGREDSVSPTSMEAPEMPGPYIVRYLTQNRDVLAETSFTAVPVTATVSAPEEVAAGSEFEVEWTGPRNGADLVRIFSEGGEETFDYAYTYRDRDISPAKLTAPEDPGTYEIRYFTKGKNTLAITTVTVVTVEATISAPNEVAAGSEFNVGWSGPKNKNDMVRVFSADGEKLFDFAYTYRDRDASPASITAPEMPGRYEIRYYTSGKKTLASAAFTVVAVEASIAAPQEVVAGAQFDVEWTGPKNKNDMVRVFSADGKKLFKFAFVYRDRDTSPAKVTAPETPDNYEVRYYTSGKKTLASATFTVIPAKASVDAPASVIAGEDFNVAWTGPKNKNDMVRIFSADGKKLFDLAFVYRDRDTSPARLTAPDTPGKYEVRYFTAGKNTLASDVIEVK